MKGSTFTLAAVLLGLGLCLAGCQQGKQDEQQKAHTAAVQKQLDAVKAELAHAASAKAAADTALTTAEEALTTAKEQLTAATEEHTKALQDMQKQLDAAKTAAGDVDKLTEEAKARTIELSNAKQALAKLQGEYDASIKAKAQLEQTVADQKKTIEDLQKKLTPAAVPAAPAVPG